MKSKKQLTNNVTHEDNRDELGQYLHDEEHQFSDAFSKEKNLIKKTDDVNVKEEITNNVNKIIDDLKNDISNDVNKIIDDLKQDFSNEKNSLEKSVIKQIDENINDLKNNYLCKLSNITKEIDKKIDIKSKEIYRNNSRRKLNPLFVLVSLFGTLFSIYLVKNSQMKSLMNIILSIFSGICFCIGTVLSYYDAFDILHSTNKFYTIIIYFEFFSILIIFVFLVICVMAM